MRVCNRYAFDRFFRRTQESDLPHRLGIRRLLTDEWDDLHVARRRRQSDVRKKAVRLLNRRIGCPWKRVQHELEALLRRESRNEADRLQVRREVLELAEGRVDDQGSLRRPERQTPSRPTYLSADELRREPELIRNRK